VLPLHLIENDSALEIVESGKVLRTPVYMWFFSQPYYRAVHSVLLKEVKEYFGRKLSQGV
jgi:hypothetical protein